jgi:Carboxypeptidase regulatory-like domain
MPVGLLNIKCGIRCSNFTVLLKTTKMKKIVIAITLVCISFLSLAQQKSISGKLINAQQKPIAYANIALNTIADGTTVKGTISDSLGNFSLVVKNDGSYKITVSSIGYVAFTSIAITIDSNHSAVVLPTITLNPQAKKNDNITVTAKKKFIEIQADKTVLNVENNIAAVGNSAFELIKKAPAVTVDKDENLKLKGGIATIYIDGKPFYLQGDQLVQYLKNLQADAISKIEIIGNPSSKFDAAGLNGIINIRLKKNKQYGTNGSVTFGTGYGRFPKVNGSASLNHRTKNVNIFSDASLGYSESFNRLTYNSLITNGAAATLQSRENYWNPKTTWNSFKLGADFSVSKKTILGVLIKGNGDNMKAITDNQTIFSNQTGVKTQRIITTKNDEEKTSNYSYNVNLKTELDSLGILLTKEEPKIRITIIF